VQAQQPVLVTSLPFGPRLEAAAVAAAIAKGLHDGGLREPDVYPLGELAADFDARMRASKAVVIAAPRLDEQTLVGSLPFEIATRARQTGVPCYAVTRENELDLFDARILDLQVVLQAGSVNALRKAGRTLADVV
jgi:glycerate 2-kinase